VAVDGLIEEKKRNLEILEKLDEIAEEIKKIAFHQRS
jgi:hypothetical protein